MYEALQRSQDVFAERYTFNTMIAGVMEAMNALGSQENRAVWTEGYWILTSILEPVVPHICWEISSTLFDCKNLAPQTLIDEVFEVDAISMGVSVNGKKRSEIEVGVNDDNETILALAKESVEKWIEGKEIVKEIVIPSKLVNIVIKG